MLTRLRFYLNQYMEASEDRKRMIQEYKFRGQPIKKLRYVQMYHGKQFQEKQKRMRQARIRWIQSNDEQLVDNKQEYEKAMLHLYQDGSEL
jgi:hypothetical protein